MKNKSIYWINIIGILLICVADFLYIKIDCSAYITKTLASCLFVLLALINVVYELKFNKTVKFKWYKYFMLVGLVFACLGDIFLIDFFIIGAILFAIGHIFFFIGFCSLCKFKWWDLLTGIAIFAVCLIILLTYKGFSFGSMTAIVIAYALIISLMLGKSITNCFYKSEDKIVHILIAVGAALFFLSDLALVFNVFANAPKVVDILCLVAYYPAEAILAASIFFVNDKLFKKPLAKEIS